MKQHLLIKGLLPALAAMFLLAGCDGDTWRDVGVGAPVPAGRHTWDGKTLTVTGAGLGLDVQGRDQCQFACITREAGNFEVVARLVDVGGGSNATAGILVRTDSATNGAMTALFFRSKDRFAGWTSRIPAQVPHERPRVLSGGIELAQGLPLWLKMVRLDGNFAVYKSRDGRLWSMLSNVSGGPCALDGRLAFGFFVASAAEDTLVTATFDSIRVGAARMRYKTSWVGNTFGSRDADKHVSNSLSAMWVAPDGTCYTSAYWDEGGRPVTSYRDGQAARGLPIGTPQTAEGAITGDGQHLFVAAVDRVIVLDPAKSDFAPRPLALSVSLLDKKLNRSVVSGLAASGRELFVADSRDNLIRVASLDPVHLYCKAMAANFGVALAPEPVGVSTNDPRFAPAAIYQTQRVGEGFLYTIPGQTPGATYTVRCHLAAYAKGTRGFSLGRDNEVVSVEALAGGLLEPVVKDLTGYQANTNGQVVVAFGGYDRALCGLELLDPSGKRAFAVNCGGPPVGDFKGESEELVDRAFAFERPGPMTIDRRGNLWIIQRGNDFPIGGTTSAKYPAAVKCYRTDGTFTGREITDVVNPRALGYDAARDQLLVAENGLDLNVRFYTGLDAQPALARTFGAPGGIYAGNNPGLVHDPAAGGYARFAGIAGVGVDAQGNLYVGGGLQGTDLRMFSPDGTLGWMVNSLMFCNTYDFDPASDGADLYGTYNHLKLDLSQSEPGSEQTYVGYNWDIRNFESPVRAGSSQSIVRRLGADQRLFMFTSGQGTVGDIHIFRYAGELAIPAGGVVDQGTALWVDANGNGLAEPDETSKMGSSIGWITALCVDSKGDIWTGQPTTGGSFMRRFYLKGVNTKGVPIYSGVAGEGYEDIRFPEEGDKTNAWGMAVRLDYDADRDTLVAVYPAVPRRGEGDTSPAQYFMGRYDHWSQGNRVPTWKVRVLTPYTDPDYFMYEVKLYPYSGYMGMQVAGDYVFMAYLFGEVHVFDRNTGELVEILAMGPEVNGQSAWEDAAMGLRAFKRRNGEYLVLTENSGWGGKNNLFRWKPAR